MSHQEDDGTPAPDIMRERMRRETLEHLRDIRREHGAGRHWANLALPRGTPHLVIRPLLHSASGSPAALCAIQRAGRRWTPPASTLEQNKN